MQKRRWLVDLGKRSIKKYIEHDMPLYAAALSFRAFVALIPFSIFLVALLAYLPIPGFFDWLLGKAQQVLSGSAMGQAKLVLQQVRDFALGGWLALAAIVVAVWSASTAVRTLMTAVNVAYGAEDRRPAWKRYPLSILLAVGLTLATVLASALMLIGAGLATKLLSQMGVSQELVAIWTWLRWPLAVLVLMIAVALVYHISPDIEEPFHFITWGTILAVSAWVVASVLLHYYVLHFANYSVMYGALGAVLMLLLYFYVLAAVLLLGAEVNAGMRGASKGAEEEPPNSSQQ
jgi:membrane protein